MFDFLLNFDSGQIFASMSSVKCDESICCTVFVRWWWEWNNRNECSLKKFSKSHKTHYFCYVERVLDTKASGWLWSWITPCFIPLHTCNIKQLSLEICHLFKYRIGYLDERIILMLLSSVLIFSYTRLVPLSSLFFFFGPVCIEYYLHLWRN